MMEKGKMPYEATFTSIPNIVFDVLPQIHFFTDKLALLLIARQTIGYGKLWDRLTGKKASEYLGMDFSTFSLSTIRLKKLGYIKKERVGRIMKYCLNPNYFDLRHFNLVNSYITPKNYKRKIHTKSIENERPAE